MTVDPSTAQIVVAVIGFAGVLATVIGVQLKVHADNRRDHGETAAAVGLIQRDVTYIRSDVTDIHGAIHELRRSDHLTDGRVTRLERKHNTGDDAA